MSTNTEGRRPIFLGPGPGPSLRSDGRRGRRAQDEIGADPPFIGLIFDEKDKRLMIS